MQYDNAPTVVDVLVPVHDGLLLVRRNLKDGFGKLAIPGGYQMRGETWQEAGAREVLEETGVMLDPRNIMLLDVVTSPAGMNILFSIYDQRVNLVDLNFRDAANEIQELVIVKEPVETAFPIHTEMVRFYFEVLAV